MPHQTLAFTSRNSSGFLAEIEQDLTVERPIAGDRGVGRASSFVSLLCSLTRRKIIAGQGRGFLCEVIGRPEISAEEPYLAFYVALH